MNQNSMSKKIIYGLITIVIFCLVGFGVYVYDKSLVPAQPSQNNPSTSTSDSIKTIPPSNLQNSSSNSPSQNGGKVPAPKSTSTPVDKPVFSSGEGQSAGSNIQVKEVDFDGNQFSPKEVTVKVNDYIFFKNKSSLSFQPASGSSDYPNFGPTTQIAPEKEYRFQFTKAGRLDYYDKISNTATGSIIIQ